MFIVVISSDPLIGATCVTLLSTTFGANLWNGIDFIAKTIDSNDTHSNLDSVRINDSSLNNVYTVTPCVMDTQEVDTALTNSSTTYLIPYDLPIDTSRTLTPLSDSLVPTSGAASMKHASALHSIPAESLSVFYPVSLVVRLLAAVTTLSSGCSLGTSDALCL